jgi:long-chain acyl-CoA synthetase
MNSGPPEMLALQRLCHWEQTAPQGIALTQPMGGGKVRDFTWAQVAEQVRRIAAHLQAQRWEASGRSVIWH